MYTSISELFILKLDIFKKFVGLFNIVICTFSYRCEALNSAASAPIVVTTKLIVYFPPQNVSVSYPAYN